MILRQLKDTVCLKPITNITRNDANLVPSATLTTIVTLTAIVKHSVSRISCSGDCYAQYELYIDNVLIETKVSAPNYAIDFKFHNELVLNVGQILDVKVTHFYTGEQGNFKSTIYSRV